MDFRREAQFISSNIVASFKSAESRQSSKAALKSIVACFVYVIASARGGNYRTYVGWTTDLDRRLQQHNNGTGAKSTRGQQWFLLYAERYDTRRAAMSREWYLKRDKRMRKMLVPARY